ncbi:MAG: hypothetical protein PHH75_01595 [Candidatus Omnitrophica bacterium]|nr:hypothetical protein [Candidatus Omnitrophota bacterium]MDD5573853.1 hypothetical protein [Candidatus Omnitrophota bacterium]
MKRCRQCHVPLEGRWANILKKILKLETSRESPDLCNKCDAANKKKKSSSGYICRICNRRVDETIALTHVKTEEYLLELIRKDHPEWKEEHGACPKCIDYYRQLIKRGGI